MPFLLHPTLMRVSELRSPRVPAGRRLHGVGPPVGRTESGRNPLAFRWPWLESHELLGWLTARVREGWDLRGEEVEAQLVAC